MSRSGRPCTSAVLVGLALVVSLMGPPALRARVSPFVPLEHSVYAFVDLAQSMGLAPGHVYGTRPWTRDRLRAVLQSIESRLDDGPPYLRERFLRFAREFSLAVDRGEGRGEETEPPTRDGTRLDGYRLRFARLRDHHLWNDFGREVGDGAHGLAVVDGRVRLASRLVLNLSFQFEKRPAGRDGEADRGGELLEASLSTRLGPVLVMAGRQPMAWGAGATGALLVSSNARPVDHLRLESVEAFRMRFLGEHLGRWTFFLGRLEEERVVPNARWAGLRFDFRSSPRFEWHLQRSWLYGGDRDPSAPFSIPAFLWGVGENALDGAIDFGDQLAGFGARFRQRLFGLDGQFYVELYGEDLAAAFPTQKSGLYGVHLPRLGGQGRFGLRFEHVSMATVAYTHYLYATGYRFHGRVLGHAFEAADAHFDWAQLVWHAHARWDVELDWREEGGAGDDQERGLALRWSNLRASEWSFDMRRLRSVDRPEFWLAFTRRW